MLPKPVPPNQLCPKGELVLRLAPYWLAKLLLTLLAPPTPVRPGATPVRPLKPEVCWVAP